MVITFPSDQTWSGHPIELSMRKLRDASGSLQEAGVVWEEFLAQSDFDLEVTKDPNLHSVAVVVRGRAHPPLEKITRLFRACVNDARSAMDNLVTRLAYERQAAANQLKRVAFPSAETVEEWRKQNWDQRLRMLDAETIGRLQAVQPFNYREQVGPPHPLLMLHRLWNTDKHGNSFEAGISLSPASGSLMLGSFDFTVANESLDDAVRHMSDVDGTISVAVGPINDGTRLWSLTLPPQVNLDTFEIHSVNAEFALGLVGPGVLITDPAIPLMENALRYCRETVRYVANVLDFVPVCFPAGMIQRHRS